MAKLHWNNVISTPGARYMCLDIKNFYLTACLKYFEYMQMPLTLFPKLIQIQFNMKTLAYKGYVHLEMRRAIWGLPQARILANKKLHCKLAPFGYFKHVNMPGFWYHESRPISITLVVDNFGVKYVNKDNDDHLIVSIKTPYTLTKDCLGDLYCRIALSWDYINRMVDISMLGYIKKKIQEYNHVIAKRNQTCPYAPAPKQFGTEAQALLPTNDSPCLDKVGI
jgi:hypothetical protein